MHVLVRLGASLALVVLLLSACGDGEAADSTSEPSGTPVGVTGELRVAAAASLTEVFTAIGEAFEADHPGADVVFDFGPSSGLADSILGGSPTDVFASADTKNMDLVVDGGSADGEPQVFAVNSMRIAVPEGNPGEVQGLDDFARGELLVGLCAADVPCGRLAREVLTNAGVTPSVDSDEPDVKALLGKVEQDELDAGIVYVTDVIGSDAVEGIEIAADVNVATDYPIVAVADSDAADLADAFVEHVLSTAGQELLEQAGFALP